MADWFFPAEWTERRPVLSGLDREILELREEVLSLCPRPERVGGASLLDCEVDFDARRRREITGRLAIALGDLDLAREIDLIPERTRTSVRILRDRGDDAPILALIRDANRISDLGIRTLTVKALTESVNGELLRNLHGPILRIEDQEIRERLLGRLVLQLRAPDYIRKVKGFPERIFAMGAGAISTRRVDLAVETLRLALLEDEEEETLCAAAEAAYRVADERLFRRMIKIACRIKDPEVKITVFDLLGGATLKRQCSRIAFRLVLQLPEYEPEIEDGYDFGDWEGTRAVPLARMAKRHQSPALARRVRDDLFRNGALAQIAADLNRPDLANEVTDDDYRMPALFWIATQTVNLPLIEALIDEIRGDEEKEYYLPDALATKAGILRRRIGLT